MLSLGGPCFGPGDQSSGDANNFVECSHPLRKIRLYLAVLRDLGHGAASPSLDSLPVTPDNPGATFATKRLTINAGNCTTACCHHSVAISTDVSPPRWKPSRSSYLRLHASSPTSSRPPFAGESRQAEVVEASKTNASVSRWGSDSKSDSSTVFATYSAAQKAARRSSVSNEASMRSSSRLTHPGYRVVLSFFFTRNWGYLV